MIAGWMFCKNDRTDGQNIPHLPPGVGGQWTAPLEIHRVTGGPPGFEHTHTLIGGGALRSVDRIGQPDEAHFHYVVWYGNQYHQVTMDAANHTHDLSTLGGVLSPDWFLLFWKGSNADAAAIAADPLCIVAVQAIGEEVVEELPEVGIENLIAAFSPEETVTTTVFEELDTTPWTPAERTQWETRIASVMALELPVEVDSGDKLVAYFCGALVSRAQQRERWLRFN